MSTANKNFRTIQAIASGALAVCTALAGVSARADLSISQVPLFLSTSSSPNIMFVLDDSGSMQWEIMPDGFMSNSNNQTAWYVFPRAAGIYGAGDYGNQVPGFDPTDDYSVTRRSSHGNATYYNPAITYSPWVESDGTRFPDAVPTCAYHNPYNTGAGCRNLTVDNTQTATWIESSSQTNESRTFYPATYFVYDGVSDDSLATSYTRVEIRSANAPFTGSAARTDCAAAPSCTYQEELRNFANWYTYYRSRILAARAGVGRAFAQQGRDLRVGFGAINQAYSTIDGVGTRTVISGVRPFDGQARTDWFDDLYGHTMPTSNTPLRRALDDVGRYYQRTDSAGPWGTNPGSNDGAAQLECRQSYTILMTDGFWNSDAASTAGARLNVDNSDGPTITAPDGTSYQYTPEHPYQDDWSDTLADIAMYYWNRDLRPDLDNLVAPNQEDEAFWQHMVTFGVGLGVNGQLDPNNDWDGLVDGSVAWPDPNTDNTARLDDLWHAAVNSRGGFFSAGNPDEFADALSSTLSNIAGRTASAASVAANSGFAESGTLVYQARFNSSDWTGQLLAFTLDQTGVVGGLQWDAADRIPGPALRRVYTYNPTTQAGTTFDWGNLSTGQQTFLNTDINGTVDGLGQDRVAYIKGDQTRELGQTNGVFRMRSSILGDVINSDPLFVGNQDFAFTLLPAPEGPAYASYRASTSYLNRTSMLYFGANDGMLHAVDAETGDERFAYVPNGVYENLSDLTSPNYTHRYYVDGATRAVDAYINGQWGTVLVGTLGGGGRSVFALDVTDPSAFTSNDVLWEFSDPELGVTISEATVARIRYQNKWVAVFGNGYNSASDTAQLFVVDLEDGSLIRRIDTGVGTAAQPNGLGTPVPVDVDGDRITDYVYAGDLWGNLWKFDLSGSSANSLEVAFTQGQNKFPLFTACTAATCTDSNRQPITARPEIAAHPDGGVMVFFGTGKFFEVGDNIVGATPPVETFYGIRDSGVRITGGRGALQQQTIDVETANFRQVSGNQVTYSSQSGWYLDLTPPSGGNQGERVIDEALFRLGRIIFVTVIPSGGACDFGGESWLMELDAFNGDALNVAVFDTDADDDIDADDDANVVGRRFDNVAKLPKNILEDTERQLETKALSDSSGQIEAILESGAPPIRNRQSWRELR